MKTVRHQISLFTPGAAYGNMSRVLSLLMSRCADVLDAPPTSLPVPADAPPDIPRIILQSARKDKELTLRLDRVDAAFFRNYEEAISDEELRRFQNEALGWMSPLLEEFGIEANRLGVVIQRAMTIDGSPASFLARKFCRDEYLEQPFGNSRKFEIHNLKNYEYCGANINSWVRIQTLNDPGTGREVISIVNDLNNIPTKSALTFEHIRGFVENSIAETSEILSYYNFRQEE